VKITNNEAIQIQQALVKLNEIDLPVKASMDIAILTGIIENQVKAFSMARTKIFKQYAIKTEPGIVEGTVRFVSTKETDEEKQKCLDEFMSEFNKLVEETGVDFEFGKITIPQEFGGKPVAIKGNILAPLLKFIEIK
jgi:hypothetical protein